MLWVKCDYKEFLKCNLITGFLKCNLINDNVWNVSENRLRIFDRIAQCCLDAIDWLIPITESDKHFTRFEYKISSNFLINIFYFSLIIFFYIYFADSYIYLRFFLISLFPVVYATLELVFFNMKFFELFTDI